MMEAVAAQSPAVAMDDAARAVRHQPVFSGRTGEYFGIWFVNLLLGIVTLGIYSAWGKVRTERYFYGNTALAGSSFDYLADPIAILKGRLIAYAVVIALVLSSNFLPVLYVLLILALFALIIYLAFGVGTPQAASFIAGLSALTVILISIPLIALMTILPIAWLALTLNRRQRRKQYPEIGPMAYRSRVQILLWRLDGLLVEAHRGAVLAAVRYKLARGRDTPFCGETLPRRPANAVRHH